MNLSKERLEFLDAELGLSEDQIAAMSKKRVEECTMSKNDYFAIAYRILTYLYNCFMAGEKPEAELFGPDALGINNGYWVNTMESLYNEGYITGIVFTETLGSGKSAKLIDLKITQKGIAFLHENSLIAKAKRTLKDVKDIIPGF